MKIDIRVGTVADAAMLAAFAARTFRHTFASENTPEDMALYLAETFGVERQRSELEDGSITTLLAEVGGELAGYGQLRQGAAPESVSGGTPIELWRLYVAGKWHGRGVAGSLMDAVIAEARRLGAVTLWLGVWERNGRAQSFYRRYGFSDVGSHTFLLGTDAQVDRIWVRPLAGD